MQRVCVLRREAGKAGGRLPVWPTQQASPLSGNRAFTFPGGPGTHPSSQHVWSRRADRSFGR